VKEASVDTPKRPDTHLHRFSGVDGFRILATYAVVGLHSGFNQAYAVTSSADAFQDVLNFAVPTFLALAFFLQISRKNDGGFNISARLQRLMVPYLVWTALHLIARAAKYAMQHQPAKIHELISDPVALLLFGAASVQLYFLPLLFVGGCLCAYLNHPLRAAPTFLLLIFLVLAVLANHQMIVSGNGFDLSAGRAFQVLAPPHEGHPIFDQITRIVLVCICWMIRCLPYIIGLSILVRYVASPVFTARWLLIPWVALFVFFDLIPLPSGLNEIAIGLSAVASATILSTWLPPSRSVSKIANFTFGIFLVHDLVLEVLEMVSKRFLELHISLIQLVAISVTAFSISAMVVWIGSRLGKAGRTVFAIG